MPSSHRGRLLPPAEEFIANLFNDLSQAAYELEWQKFNSTTVCVRVRREDGSQIVFINGESHGPDFDRSGDFKIIVPGGSCAIAVSTRMV